MSEEFIALTLEEVKLLKLDPKILSFKPYIEEASMNTKYLFICGSVASGIGKGITNSSVGLLLKEYGFEVSFMKIDPYLV